MKLATLGSLARGGLDNFLFSFCGCTNCVKVFLWDCACVAQCDVLLYVVGAVLIQTFALNVFMPKAQGTLLFIFLNFLSQ